MSRWGVPVRSVWLLLFTLLALGATAASAQPDPSILNWGSPPGSPPPWQTSDIYVDNDGNGVGNEASGPSKPGEPSKGLTNWLFARVRNLGSSAATNVTVRFHFAPYGPWSPASWGDFKEISVVTGVNLGPAGSPTAEQLIQVPWDLSDLSDNNGGAWGGHTVGEFDHFCVLVRVELPGDSNPANNTAQNNFTNVETVFGEPFSLKLLVANPAQQEMRGSLLIRGIPDDWKLRLEGIQSPKEFVLKPREFRVVTLTLQPPAARSEDAKELKQHVDLSLQLNQKVVGGVSFDATVSQTRPLLFPPSGGVLAPYILGTWDSRGRRATALQLVNPTGQYIYVWVAFFDDNEKPLKCVREKLSPNDLLELEVRKVVDAGYGVVKVVAFRDDAFTRPTAGVVGYQRQFSSPDAFSEAPLHSIPVEILRGDFKRIQAACQ